VSSPSSSPSAIDPAAHRPKVLLAEHDRAFRALLLGELEKAGCDVIAIADGAQFIDYLARARRGSGDHPVPRVIVTDTCMPGPSGLDILHGLHVSRFPAAVIVITGFGSAEMGERALALGARAVFGKPFEIEDLIDAVRALTAG
jgi:CheY-like chemotaxis protein